MTYSTGTLAHADAGRGGFRARLASFVAPVSAAFREAIAAASRRKAVFDLSRLDDRMLADMGLTRGDLHEASRWSLWGDASGRLVEIAESRRLNAGNRRPGEPSIG